MHSDSKIRFIDRVGFALAKRLHGKHFCITHDYTVNTGDYDTSLFMNVFESEFKYFSGDKFALYLNIDQITQYAVP